MSSVAVVEPPLEPVNLAGQVTGSRVSLTWAVRDTSSPPTDFIVEAGATPASFNLLSQRLGSTQPGFEATGVPSGTYYVRVRAANAVGIGEPSATLEIRVP